MLGTFQESEWVENFQMKKEMFDYLCNKLRPTLYQHDTQLRKALRRELPLLYGASLQQVSIGQFGVAKSTACSIVHETCSACL